MPALPVFIQPDVQCSLAGVDLGVRSFEYKAPPDGLGASAIIQLADVEKTILATDLLTLKVGFKSGSETSRKKLLKNAVLASRSHRVAYINDELQVAAGDAMANKWETSPPNAIKLYDPIKVTITEEERNTKDNITDEDGNPIPTEFKPIPNFNLQHALDFVFKEKLGFAGVITNIPIYPLRELSFTINASFYEVINETVGFFEPIFAPTDNDEILVLYPYGVLPTNLPIKPMSAKSYTTAIKEQPVRKIVTSILMSYQTTDNAVNYVGPVTTKFEVDSAPPVGSPGSPGYQQTVIERHTAELHNDINNPAKVTQEIEFKTITRVFGFVRFPGINVLLSEETQEDTYTHDYQRKIKHIRTVSKRLKSPGEGTSMLENVLVEETHIQWDRSTYNPDEYIKTWSTNKTRGIVVITGVPDFTSDNDPYNDVQIYPITDANILKVIDEDDPGDSITDVREILSVTEFWRELGNGQVNVYVNTVDHISGLASTSKSINHISDPVVNRDDNNTIVKTQLIHDDDAVALYGYRKPLSVDAGAIPFEIALPVIKEKLRRAGSAPRNATVEMPTFDPSVRRGTIRKLKLRNDVNENFLILGVSVKAEALDGKSPRITTTLEGIILDAES